MGAVSLKDHQKKIIGGMTVLSLVGIICKLVGAFYRVPLAWIIGEEGLATYQLVFPTYNMLLTISSAGLPVAISRMVSYMLAKDDPRGAKRFFRLALYILSAMGFITMILMIALSPALAGRTGDPATQPGFVAIAPALLLVCTMSALRGFMQGQQNMVPTAISQLIEQVGKVAIVLPLAWIGMKTSVAAAAAGVLLGTSLAEAVALLYMYIVYRRKRTAFDALVQSPDVEEQKSSSLIRTLLSMSIPITIGSCIVPFAAFIDSRILLNRLMDAGLEFAAAKPLYGRYSGYVLTLINVPTALATAIAISLVPSISDAAAREDTQGIRQQSLLGLRLSTVIGLPCSIGLSLLSAEALSLIYHFNTPQDLQSTARLLSLSSLTIVIFTMVQSTTGILQGLKKQRIPMYTLAVGVAVKIFLNYTLIAIPEINITGAPIASIACYTISMVPNLLYVHKYTGLKPAFGTVLIRPLLASLAMGALLLLLKQVLPSGRLWTLVMILAGMISYIGFAVLFGAVSREELKPIRRKLFHK